MRPQQGLAEARRLLGGWWCVNACSGVRFEWDRAPTAKHDCARVLVAAGVTNVDVYCVHPDADKAQAQASVQQAARGREEPGGQALRDWFAQKAGTLQTVTAHVR